MKVAVVSNCQGESFALCLSAINVGFAPTYLLSSGAAFSEENIQLLAESEIIFAQRGTRAHIPAEFANKIVLFPTIAFSGFHPDISYARALRRGSEAVETIHGHMSSYHSAIAMTGYCSGLTAEATIALFNADTYHKLGYFEFWDRARRDLLAEGEMVGVPLGELFSQWTRRGAFMYSFNHPEISVVADIARVVIERIGIIAVNHNVAQYLNDPLKAMPIWPVYPEIGRRLGIKGDMNFVCLHTQVQMGIRQFVETAYQVYDHYERDTIEPLNFKLQDYQAKLGLGGEAPSTVVSSRNPYAGLPKTQFWRDSVANVEPGSLDPVVNSSLVISRQEKVATAGSCFAQHIARTLARSGFNYFVSETAPDQMSEDLAQAENYGVFSARYGNIYTVRQLAQLFDRVDNRFIPSDQVWRRKDGRLVDPFRPQISQAGFGDEAELEASRQEHFTAVRRLFAESDVFVFTLGLTEGWRSKIDGAVYPLAPGVAGGDMDPTRYEFVNFTHEEIVNDLHQVIDRLRARNGGCRVILTVSPVPLIATYEPRHALVATTYSKSVLRAAADEIASFYDHVEYFPSYEIITGSYNRGSYYEDDLRTVTEDGVRHVMRVFMDHYAEGSEAAPVQMRGRAEPHKPSALFDIVCDEEAIANFDLDEHR